MTRPINHRGVVLAVTAILATSVASALPTP